MVNDFSIQVKQPYLASGKDLQNTSDIKNPILEAFSAIDSVAEDTPLRLHIVQSSSPILNSFYKIRPIQIILTR